MLKEDSEFLDAIFIVFIVFFIFKYIYWKRIK